MKCVLDNQVWLRGAIVSIIKACKQLMINVYMPHGNKQRDNIYMMFLFICFVPRCPENKSIGYILKTTVLTIQASMPYI